MSETIVYHTYSQSQEAGGSYVQINLLEGMAVEETLPIVAKPTFVERVSKFSLKTSLILAFIGIVVLATYFVPGILSKANFSLSSKEVTTLSASTQNSTTRALPAFNPGLTKENHLAIPSIGVDTDIQEATYDNYDSALKEGVWRVSNFGQPDKMGAPVILAAHRYGYLAWANTFRHTSSFYNLPKVKVGDIITIDWQQREYSYGVYKTETGTAITDYSGDLILYTCESLNGDERIFVYAKLI